jgi:hypothetical protein
LVEKPKAPLGIPRCRWDDNIKMILKYIPRCRWDDNIKMILKYNERIWTGFIWLRIWRANVNTAVMNLRVP